MITDTETTVVKKGKGPFFWIMFTSFLWVLILVICAVITFLLIGSNQKVQTIVRDELGKELGFESAQEPTPVEVEDKTAEVETLKQDKIELETKLDELQDQLDKYKLEEEFRKKYNLDATTTPTKTTQPTPTVSQ